MNDLNGAVKLEEQPRVNRGTCQNCKFGQISMTANQLQLTCKEDSPKIIGNVLPVEVAVPTGKQMQLQWFTQACWPVVGKDEWCGKWQLDPNSQRAPVVENATGLIHPS